MQKWFAVPLVFLVCFSALTFLYPLGLVHAAVYTYTVSGPYFEDGSVPYNTTLGIGVLWVNGATLHFNMTSSIHVANTTTFTSSAPAFQMLWNNSNALNLTRIYDFSPSDTAEALTVSGFSMNVYTPSTVVPADIYSFSITDFAGMTHPFLQTSISTTGVDSNPVEQFNLSDTTGTVTFVMAQYGTYGLTFLCDQGSYTQQFTAGATFSNTLSVLAGNFPAANVTIPTATVTRVNSTMIGIAYQDPSNNTSWLSVLITHPSGALIVNDYFTNASGSIQTVLWNGADLNKDYNVNVTSLIGSQLYIWALEAANAPNSNPFVGVFDFLGQSIPTMPYVATGWPANMNSGQIAQLIGAAIITLFLCIGSFRSAGASCILAWAIAGIMMYLGWWGNSPTTYATVPMFVGAGFLGLMIHLGEAKQSERDV